jgi:uncharacterized protein
LIDILLLLLTFALGALLSRVSLCAVAAVQQLIIGREAEGLRRVMLATSGAGLSLLLLAVVLPQQVWLPSNASFGFGVIAGGVLLGIGAMINGGCYLGSVLYLGTGNLNFLFTLAGIGLGLRAAMSLLPTSFAASPGLRMIMGPAWLLGICGFVLAVVLLMRGQRPGRLVLALLAGLLAGLVYARKPGWSYGALLQSLLQGRSGLLHWRDNVPALALFIGAIAGAVVAGRLHWQRLALVRSLRCLAGGFAMGAGAALVPGGNDTLLLWAIPGLTLRGVLAYAVMLATIALGFISRERLLQRRQAHPSPRPPR